MNKDNDCKREREIHLGDNVRKLRELKRYKQDMLAHKLGISQAKMSRLESQSYIDDETLTKIATAMKLPVDAIKNFDTESIIKMISGNLHDESGRCISPLEKVVESYERQMREKQEFYERMLQDKDRLIENYKRLLNK